MIVGCDFCDRIDTAAEMCWNPYSEGQAFHRPPKKRRLGRPGCDRWESALAVLGASTSSASGTSFRKSARTAHGERREYSETRYLLSRLLGRQ